MPYEKYPQFKEPAPAQQMWRYMDFSKFTALLQNKNYYPSLNQFDSTDPWEGVSPKLNFNPERPLILKNMDNSFNNNTKPFVIDTLSESLGNQFDNYVTAQKNADLELRKICYVNCWHMNNSESDSQWKIYGNNHCSVAIISNFERLKESITDNKTIYGSEVTYYHPEKDTSQFGNFFFNFVLKRKAFLHEQEFRLIHFDGSLFNNPEPPTGIYVSIDLNKLIERIVISPLSQAWFVEVVINLINKYGFKFPVYKSDLLKKYY